MLCSEKLNNHKKNFLTAMEKEDLEALEYFSIDNLENKLEFLHLTLKIYKSENEQLKLTLEENSSSINKLKYKLLIIQKELNLHRK